MAITGRKVYNDLGEAYFVAKKTISEIDFQAMLLVDSSGNEISSLPVTIAPTSYSAISYQAQANVTASSGVILAANSARKGGWIKSLGSNDQDIVVTFAGTATLVLPSRLAPGMVLPIVSNGYLYTGVISAISVSGTQIVEIVEI